MENTARAPQWPFSDVFPRLPRYPPWAVLAHSPARPPQPFFLAPSTLQPQSKEHPRKWLTPPVAGPLCWSPSARPGGSARPSSAVSRSASWRKRSRKSRSKVRPDPLQGALPASPGAVRALLPGAGACLDSASGPRKQSGTRDILRDGDQAASHFSRPLEAPCYVSSASSADRCHV